MGLKNYIISTVLFIIIVFGFVHSLELGEYTLNIFGFSQTFSVAFWLILPVVFLVFVTYIHIIFYGVVNHFKLRLMNEDVDTLIELIGVRLLGKESKTIFKTKKLKEISNILNQLELEVKEEDRFNSTNENLNKTVEAIQDINSGKYINERSLKIDDNSSLGKQNLLNRIEEQSDFALEVIKKQDKYNQDIVKAAFIKVLEDKSMTTIKKIYKNIKLDKELTCKLFTKDRESGEFGFSNDEIVEIMKDLDFDKKDYVLLAKNYQNSLSPDRVIELFEKLSNQDEKAIVAYLYLLSRFEMNDKIREVIDGSSEEDYTAFKALIDLKDAGKHYSLDKLSYK